MKITKEVYQEIQKCIKITPPESGGILGSNKNVVITFIYDKGINNEKMCSYSPNVNLLNSVITEWKEKGVLFAGIFHAHYFGVKTLSCGDINYIEKIMMNMPSCIKELYFPLVVMPEREVIVYKAIRKENQVLIQEDELIIQ